MGAAAVARRTRAGRPIGERERVDAHTALGLYLGGRAAPGGPRRRVEVGAPADLCLLEGGLGAALAEPTAERVRAVFVAGEPVHHRT